MKTEIFARHALTPAGWLQDVLISIDENGLIAGVEEGGSAGDHTAGIVLPALSNLHSHCFQRAMAGLAENHGGNRGSDFWSWRQVMYRFLEALTPEDVTAIAAQAQMEMLQAGFAAQAEFHYLHHGPGGRRYDAIDELSNRQLDAAQITGIGYTHLPVLYMQGGLDGRALDGGQQRFGCSLDEFEKLMLAIRSRLAHMPADYVLGVAPHSLRAVPGYALEACERLAGDGPIHIHIAEQMAEVEEVTSFLKARPVQWLMENAPVDERWCLVHATHMDDGELIAMAGSGAVAGLCPVTEANLGDGIFRAADYLAAGGTFGIGTDSNVRVGLTEELRLLEVSQRLRDRKRLVLTSDDTASNGRLLFDKAAAGGARALGRNSGALEVGRYADLVALDDDHHSLCGLHGDALLDSWIFALSEGAVSDVWAAGRHMVQNGRHIRAREIETAFKATLKRLRDLI